ncbi:MAG TPA: hypothetical protein VFE27_16245 [Acidobacteriaceae bacterium]|jgi:hypothetical protein|nr:hypothetical protein [Acidobacteriaceae bacterium]
MTLNDVLERWIPYRLQAIDTFQFAWNWLGEAATPQEVEVIVDGRLKIRGNAASIANPMIEAGIIHARALLEFLGLCVKNGQLQQIQKRNRGDIAVEYYSTPEYPLTIVNPSSALLAYPGPRKDAEDALVAVFELANRGMAHITDGTLSGSWTDLHIDIACRGIPVLLHNHLYAKLGRTIPAAPARFPNAS